MTKPEREKDVFDDLVPLMGEDCATYDAADVNAAVEAIRAELVALRKERDDAVSWAEMVTHGKSLCGHWKCYTYQEDPKGARLDCWQCRAERAERRIEEAEERGYRRGRGLTED